MSVLSIRVGQTPWKILNIGVHVVQFFDATGYAGGIGGNRAFTQAGWNQIFWPTNPVPRDQYGNAVPDLTTATYANTFFPPGVSYGLDTENYLFGYGGEPEASVLAQAGYAKQLVDWFHGFGRQSALWSGYPGNANGFGTDSLDIPAWQARNDLVGTVYSNFDYVAWQAYAGSLDQAVWNKAHVEQIYPEARRIAKGKPVYPILWNYVNGGPGNSPAIGASFFAYQISQLVAAGADGFIVWGAYGVGDGEPPKGSSWDSPPWAPVLQQFI